MGNKLNTFLLNYSTYLDSRYFDPRLNMVSQIYHICESMFKRGSRYEELFSKNVISFLSISLNEGLWCSKYLSHRDPTAYGLVVA